MIRAVARASLDPVQGPPAGRPTGTARAASACPASGDRSVTGMDEEVRAAVRRFPARQAAIEALAARDEGFRSLCADFAEAEATLRHWEGVWLRNVIGIRCVGRPRRTPGASTASSERPGREERPDALDPPQRPH